MEVNVGNLQKTSNNSNAKTILYVNPIKAKVVKIKKYIIS